MRPCFLKFLLLLSLLCFALGACSKNDKRGEGEVLATSEELREELLVMNAYAEAFNAFLPFKNNYDNLLKAYKHQNISDKTELREYRIGFRVYNLGMGLKALEKSRETSLGGAYARLEASSDALIRESKPLLKTVEILEKYQESKEYLKDKGRLAREKDGEFIRQAEAFLMAYKRFLSDYNEASLVCNRRFVEGLKNSGSTHKAYVYESYFYLKRIAMLFETVEDFKDQEKRDASVALSKSAQSSLGKLKNEIQSLSEADKRKFKELIAGLDDLYMKYIAFQEGHYRPSDFEQYTIEHNDFIKRKLNPL